MKVIHVLGIGCGRCSEMKENARAAVERLDEEYEILEVRDIDEIVEFGAMTTPALALDGEILMQGKVPTVDEIVAVLQEP